MFPQQIDTINQDLSTHNDNKAMWLSALFGITLILSSFVITLAPKAGQKVAVINFPWAQDSQAIFTIAKADANIAAVGKVGWIAIAASEKPDLVKRLYQAGAFFVIDAALIISCGIASN